MTRLFGYAPAAAATAWVILAKLTGFDAPPARMAALALAAAALSSVVFLEARSEASPIDKGMTAFTAAGTAFVWLWPPTAGTWVGRFPVTALYAVLFLVAAVPPLLKKEPFTMYFARKTTPAAVWDTEIFLTINRHLTALWALLFAAAMAASAVPGLTARRGLGWEMLFEGLIPAGLMMLVGVQANKRYPSYHQRKRGLAPVNGAGAGAAPSSGDEEKPESDPIAPQEEKEMNAKPTVVAINGSPHAGVGNTAMMLEMLRPGLAAEGFALEVITLSEHRIEYCVGCAFCMEKGKCWIPDDHAGIARRLLDADGIIFASPVYFFQVTAQFKTFLDRSLAFGHKPQATWKPGLAVCVSAGSGETQVAEYMAFLLRVYGAFAVGRLTAMATAPGEFSARRPSKPARPTWPMTSPAPSAKSAATR